MDDWDGNGKEDMFAIQKSGTVSGHTEVSVYYSVGLNETSHFDYVASFVTPLSATDANWQFKGADFDGGGTVDLIAINRAGSSGQTEVTVLTGESNFQVSQQFNTVLGNVGSNWTFDVGDYDHDGQLDLFGIEKSGGASGTTEVHVMDCAESSPGVRFQTYLLHTGTGLHSTGDEFDFHVADIDLNGSLDLVAIKKSGTSSGQTEVHVLSGAGIPYQLFSAHIATELHATDSNFEFDMIDFAGGNQNHDGLPDLVAFKKLSPGLTSTEVHVYTGEPRELANGANIPLPAGSSHTSDINFSGGISIGTEPGAPASNTGVITGDAASTATVGGGGTLQQAGNISVGQLGIDATLQLTSNASIHAANGVAVGPLGSLILGVGTTVDLGSAVTAQNGARVGGSGSILGNLTVGEPSATGTLALVAPGSSAGQLSVGHLILNPGGMLVSEIQGGTPGVSYDQIVTQSVVLNSTRLQTNASFFPAAGEEFVLVRNDGSSPVIGSFVDGNGVAISEGAIIDSDFGNSGLNARLSYAGGDGNDVVVVIDGPFTFASPANDQDNSLIVRKAGPIIQLLVDGQVVRARTAAGLTQLTVTGETGFSDQLSIDASGGNPIPSGGLIFNAGFDANDGLSLVALTADAVNHTLNGAGQNQIDLVAAGVTSTVYYSNQIVVSEDINAASRQFNFSEQSDIVVLEKTSSGDMTQLSVGLRTFVFANPTESLSLQGRGGQDDITINALPDSLAANLTIDGGAGTDSLQVNASFAGLASLTCNADTINLAGSTYSTIGSQSFGGHVTLLTNVSLSTTGTAGLTFTGSVNGAHDIKLNVPGTTTFAGLVGNFAPVGDATGIALQLNSTGNTIFLSEVRLASGLEQASSAGQVKFAENLSITGSAAASTFLGEVVFDGLVFQTAGDVTFGNAAADPLLLSGGPVTIDVTNSGATVTVNSVISGDQNLTKAGPGTLLMATPAVYSGGTQLTGGTLRLGAANLLPNGTTLNVATGTQFNLAGFNERIAALSGSGTTLLGAATLTVDGTSNATYSGVISGSGNVLKNGANRWTLSGDNTYLGWTIVQMGSLEVNGKIGAGTAAGQVSVAAGAELRGNGSINASALFSAGGTLYPTGVLAVPSISLDDASTLQVELGLSKLVVSGTVTLQTPHLAISPAVDYSYLPGADTQIIDNDGADAIVGEFADLPQGAAFNFGPERFSRILYRSADPGLINDVYAHAMKVIGNPGVNIPWGPTHSGEQIATDARGNCVIVWNDNYGAYFQLFDAAGTPTTPITAVAGAGYYGAEAKTVVMDATGNFLIGFLDTSTPDHLLRIQRFTAGGEVVGSPIIMSGIDYGMSWQLAVEGAGDFVVVWSTSYSDPGSGIFARRYTAAGVPRDSQDIVIAPHVLGEHAQNAHISMNADGAFIVGWRRDFGDSRNLITQRFDVNGVAIGSFTIVSTEPWYWGFNVALDGHLGFAVAFEQPENTLVGHHVRRYDSSGSLIADIALTQGFSGAGPEFLGMDRQGNFSVLQSTTGGNGPSLLSIFDSSGEVIATEIPLGEPTSHQFSVLSMAQDGSVVVSTRNLFDPSQITINVFNEQCDVVARNMTVAGMSSVHLNYDIDSVPVGPIQVAYFQSSDPIYDAGDLLLGTVSLSDAADLSSGAHNKIFAVGTASGEIPLPSSASDYYLLAVLDPGDFLFESDVDPILEDNTTSFLVRVNNGVPTADSQTVATNEDVAAAITLSGSDPDLDALNYTVVGLPARGILSGIAPNLNYTPGPNFNGSDSFTFKVDDGADESALATVTIHVQPVNDPPSFVSGSDVTVNEGSVQITVTGWATSLNRGPTDEATQLLTFEVATDNDSLFSELPQIDPVTGTLTFAPATGAEGSATVSVTLTDNGGGTDRSSTQTFVINVLNVAPTVSFTGPTTAVPGLPLTFLLNATDPSPTDAAAGFDFVVNWGDGATSTYSDVLTGQAANHVYSKLGTFTVRVTATDRDGATSAQKTATISVSTTVLQAGVLYIGGGDTADKITFVAANNTGNRITAKFGAVVLGTFMPTKIVAFGNGGNDTITTASARFGTTVVTPNIPLRFFGGTGNDTLNVSANRATSVLVGDSGNDTLTGSSARDILIGGLGLDTLAGNGGDDILIAGRTSHDANLAALDQLMTKWGGAGTYAARRDALLAAGGTTAKLIANPASSRTVFDDGAVDTLLGGDGNDWFLASTVAAQPKKDKVTKIATETLTQLPI